MSAPVFDQSSFLADLGLNPEAPGLTDHLPTGVVEQQVVVADTADEPAVVPTPVQTAEPTKQVVLAPPGVDPRTMPVTDIVFDPALLDRFPTLLGDDMAEASRHVFSLYKSTTRNRDRHSLLHSRIGLFIKQTREARGVTKPAGFVRAAIVTATLAAAEASA